MVEIHDGVAGWSALEELAWLSDQASVRHRILEVGAWAGRTADVLSRATPGALSVVDSWEPTDPDDETIAFDATATRAEYMAVVGGRSNVTTYMMTSAEAYLVTGHLTFDMIFLDADHRYRAVVEDILMWRSRLAPGGLLCGHDGQYPDVRRAVDELVPGAQFFSTPQPPPHEHDPALIWYAHG
jgi:predicted O-methyltransferase YrrM